MKITLTYMSQHRRKRIVLPLWSWLPLLSVTLGALAYSASSFLSQQQHRNELTTLLHDLRDASKEQQQQLDKLQKKNQDELVAYKVKLVELQSQLNRLNALGEKLASEADIPAEEFALGASAELAQGGLLERVELKVSQSQLQLDLEQFTQELAQHSSRLSLLESLYFNHHIQQDSLISGRPIEKGKGALSSYYGVRKDPFSGEPAIHRGLDFSGTQGDNVLATGTGVVTWAGERSGYGELIEIDHGKGYTTRYGHNATLLVKVGDIVSKGQTIATMGSTGRSTGAHVHYEVLRNAQQVDPVRYVYRKQ